LPVINAIVKFIQEKLRVSGKTFFLGLSLLVGLGGGLFSVLFVYMIRFSREMFFSRGSQVLEFLGSYYVVLIPAAGGLIVGPIIYCLAREAKGHGVPEVMYAVALKGGRIRPRVAVVKSLASAITIGTGGSVGREGPIIQIGAAIGSTFGQLFRMSENRIRTLVACGAAAGISATFNAPIAGAIFALEVILGEFEASTFGFIVVSSVTASVVARTFLGGSPAFAVPPYQLASPFELTFFAVLGILSAFVGLLFVKMLYASEDLFDGFKRVPEYIKPAIGGLLLGGLGMVMPEVFGTGSEAIEATLAGKTVFGVMFILVFMKMLATSLTIASGGSGGVFAPALFIGSMLGGSFGWIIHDYFPAITATHGAYALVGMASVFAATSHAPITAILIIFEMTQDYRIILPLMVSTVVSHQLAVWLSKENIYTLKLLRRGINLKAGKDINIVRSVKVADAMKTEIETAKIEWLVADLIREMQVSRHNGYPVVDDEGRIRGIVTLQDIRDIPLEKRLQVAVKDIMTRKVEIVYTDDSLEEALKKFSLRDIGRLPVVRREDPDRLVGIVTRSDIIKAYNRAVLDAGGAEVKLNTFF